MAAAATRKRRFSWWSSASWLVAILVVLVSGLLPAVARAEDAAKPKPLLLVTVPEAATADAAPLTRMVLQFVTRGLRSGLTDPSSPFSDVVPEDQAKADQKDIFDKLRSYARSSNVNVKAEAAKIQNQYKGAKPGAFLYVRVLRAEGQTIVSLERYDILPDGFPLTAFKSVETSGDVSAMLEAVAAAAALLVSTTPDHELPVAVVHSTSNLEIEPGQKVVIDGSASFDPDQDAIQWSWSADGKTIPAARIITVAPTTPGPHTYTLTVKQIVGDRASTPAKVTVTVVQPLLPNAGPSRMIPHEREPKAVKLAATRSKPRKGVKTVWRQTSGPPVALTKKKEELKNHPKPTSAELAECRAWTCYFTPLDPGLYVFEFSMRDGARARSASVSYLVVDQPHVSAGPKEIDAKPKVEQELDRNASYDRLDPELEFFWRIVGANAGDARLSDPRARNPKFTAFKPGDYKLELTARANREFNGLALVDTGRDEITVHARRAAWTLFFTSDTFIGDRYYEIGAIGVHLIVFREVFWGVDIGARAAQALFTMQLRGDESLGERLDAGGGVSVGPALTRHVPLPFADTDFTLFTGYRYRFSEKGLDVTLLATAHLFNHWSLLPDAGVEFLWPEDEGTDLYWKAGFGIGYQP